MNLRRLMSRSAFIRWLLDPYGELARDDERYEADTRLLERMRERDAELARPVRVTVTSLDCPLGDCRSCLPSLPAWVRGPVVEPDYSRHQWPSPRTPAAVKGWLIEAWPDAWYFDERHNLDDVAICLLIVRDRAMKGLVTS